MHWSQLETVLKGIYLGLLVFVALQAPTWLQLTLVAGCVLGGLLLCLSWAAQARLREGYQVRGRLPAFVLFLLLESPDLVYGGILMGLAVSAVLIRGPQTPAALLPLCVAGGALLGLVLAQLGSWRDRRVRLGLGMAVAVLLAVMALAVFGFLGNLGLQLALPSPQQFGAQLLVGVPVFYLLTFVGRNEESEMEFGALCAALGVGVFLLTAEHRGLQSLGLLLGVGLYFFYTLRVLPGLRVFKHTLRGLSYARIGRNREALLCFRRALQLGPDNALAREGLWAIHRSLDFARLQDDPETLALIDFELCLQRAGSLLVTTPFPEQLSEARSLLDLVASQCPTQRPAVQYWRAVALTHSHDYAAAAAELTAALDLSAPPAEQPSRLAIRFAAWQLALLLHPELKRRVGIPLLEQPGGHLDAIAAVERRLEENPEDAAAWDLKRLVYSSLTEAEYNRVVPSGEAASDFDHGYAQQLGLALIGDPGRWQRGAEYLRIAARGLPLQAPSLYYQIAEACVRAGDSEGARQNLLAARKAGQAVGPKNLPDAERQAYFAAVKQLADAALAKGDLQAAIDNLHLYLESERSGLETLRTLAELYERRGDPLSAARAVEQALVYAPRDQDLLDRKDKYYYSVLPENLAACKELAAPWFDVAYCIRKACSLLEVRQADLDLLDWAQHLLELARVLQPDRLTMKVTLARVLLRRGEREAAVALLEQVHAGKPEKFVSTEEEDAWFLACRLLGELYLYELGQPDRAVLCLNAFRASAKSGADTLFKLGQAFEQLGDHRKAACFYENVTSYEGHPLASEARAALYRLQTN